MNRPRSARGVTCAAALLAARRARARRAPRARRSTARRPPALGAAARAPRAPASQIATLPNGLQLAVVEMHKVPVVDVTLLVRAGAVRDPADLPGLATFTANMLDEGAGRRSALEIAEEADLPGRALSTGVGYERRHRAACTCPSASSAAALDLMADVVLRPTFADSEIARQRELRRTQILQLRDQPIAMAPRLPRHRVRRAAPVRPRRSAARSRRPRCSSRDRVDRVLRHATTAPTTPSSSSSATSRWPRRASWSPRASARGNAARCRRRRRRDAARPRPAHLLPRGQARRRAVGDPHRQRRRRRAPRPTTSRSQVLNTILGGIFTSRLNQNLRETHGYTYGASSAFVMRRLAGPFSRRRLGAIGEDRQRAHRVHA